MDKDNPPFNPSYGTTLGARAPENKNIELVPA